MKNYMPDKKNTFMRENCSPPPTPHLPSQTLSDTLCSFASKVSKRRQKQYIPNLKSLEGKVHRFHTAAVKPLVKLSAEDGALVCRFKGKEAFRVAGDGTTPESRQQLVADLREMLIHLPPEDGAKIVEHGIAVDFDAPDLAKLIETELAIKVIRKK